MSDIEPPSKKYKGMEDIGLSNEIAQLLSEEEDTPDKHRSGLLRVDPPFEELEGHYGLFGPSSMPPIIPSASHAVLFKLPVISGKVPEPFVSVNKDCWDSQHVRMPYSCHSLYPIDTVNGKILKPRWELIKEALSKEITCSKDLEDAILSYNTRYRQKWDFSALHAFFGEELDPSESEYFFENILPRMAHLALSLPRLIQSPIPLLRRRKPASISLSQKQVASLLANAFFCTFPRRNTARELSEYSSFPDINFNRLYQAHRWKPKARIGFEKLKCLIHYFRRVCTKDPDGVLTFTRHYCTENTLPKWSEATEMLPKLKISSKGRIEDEGAGMLQVDFANKFVGGGILGSGCVQEEIQFLICPELIVSRLFTEILDKTEALVISGCERFSIYKGYSETFEWVGDYNADKQTPNGSASTRDAYGRRLTSIVAIDALKFSTPSHQYSQEALLREINKAYVGFHSPDEILGLPAVATGNWGCGVFRGDAHLKALLQLMAAAKSDRDLMYFTFGNDKLRDDIYAMHNFLYSNKVPIGELWQHLCQYYDHSYQNGSFRTSLYNYLYSVLEEPSSERGGKKESSGSSVTAKENIHEMETKTETEEVVGVIEEDDEVVISTVKEEVIEKEETCTLEMDIEENNVELCKQNGDVSMLSENSMLETITFVAENG